MKRTTRRLERQYREARSNARPGVLSSTNCVRCSKPNTRLTGRLPSPRTDMTANYSGVLLRPPTTSTTSSHTADDFATFCVSKVYKIRQATSSVPPPDSFIQTRHVAQFSHFSPVTSKKSPIYWLSFPLSAAHSIHYQPKN